MGTDFVRIGWRLPKKDGVPEIYPTFLAKKSKDLMTRGKDFYAIWDESKGCWSTDQDDAVEMIDRALDEYKKTHVEAFPALARARMMYMIDCDTGVIDKWHKYVQKQMVDNYHPLDEKLVFANTPVSREDYSSKRLSYALAPGDYTAWDELVGTLYTPTERHKIEWAIGSIVSGESKKIQKFFVLYGDPGTGKSTILDIICKLFDGYYAMFVAKDLAQSGNDFALEPFKVNPLVAIQQDGDLSRIEDNTRLNSLVSHDEMVVNEKFKSKYTTRFHAMLFMATNKPVKITDSKSGIIRRLVDISPSGKKIPRAKYDKLISDVNFELGAIAYHCLEVFQADPHYYDDYIPKMMIGATNDFYNFMLENYDWFKKEDKAILNDVWFKYQMYCTDAKVPYPYQKRVVKEELKNYFMVFKDRAKVGDEWHWNYYEGFRFDKFDDSNFEKGKAPAGAIENSKESISLLDENDGSGWLKFNSTVSLLDKIGADWPAQYAYIREDGSDQPSVAWDKCETQLKDLNSAELHYLRCPEQFAFIDFDKKDPLTGEKSLELNMKAAEKWPPTYAELSKSGHGIHLTYIYNGDISKVAPVFEDDVEIKFYTGKSSLRRKLTRCNDLPIATISSGLPIRKEKKKTVKEYTIEDQKHLIAAIKKALRKEIAPYSTVCCIDYIGKVLNDAYNSGMKYDVSELRPQVLAFAAASTHNSLSCLDKADGFPYRSEEESPWVPPSSEEKEIAFFDTEVFPNLFVLVYKPKGKPCIIKINPEGHEVLSIFQTYNMVGFNNLGYDNHICYARIRGDSLYDLFIRSQNLINAPKGKNDWAIYESKNLSYTDVFDFCSEKKGLKKWEIALQKKGIEVRHDEAGLPWDRPVPRNLWDRVAEYCCNDVIATEKVFEENYSDFKAREILVELCNALRGPGSTVNDSTNNLTMKLIVGNEKAPQGAFIKPDLSKLFPGYEFNAYGFPPNKYMLPIAPADLPNNPKLHECYECQFTDSNEVKYVVTKDTSIEPGKQYYRKTLVSGKSYYKGYDPGEGGFVYANWGMYDSAECYDSASHHPSSLIAENGFGPYTENFKMLLDIRLHIKHKDYDWVRSLYNGILAPYLTSDEDAKQLSKALKIAINSVYGLTAANFTNRLRDPRNNDNWVAKRGALFMIDLMLEVQKRGYKVIHVKTDSIKIANPDPLIFQFVYDFGKKYGYTFEVEHKFEKLCLVNNAVYICKYTDDPANGKLAGQWDATGDQFKEPYVFKTLFTHEPVDFYDLTVTQTVKVGNGLYLDMDEDLPESESLEKEEEKLVKKWKKIGIELNEKTDADMSRNFTPNLTDIPDKKHEQYAQEQYHSDCLKLSEIREEIRKRHDYKFIGKAGLFCPILPGFGGGRLVRENNGKYAYASGSKGYRWLEAETVKELHLEDKIDLSYFEELKNEAIHTISEYGDFSMFCK